MKSTLLNFWESLRSSYWFVPALMAAGAFCLSYGLLSLDQRLHLAALNGMAWLYTGGAAGARSVLSTIAASVITVAGTTFSITIAALSLASSQFGPRLLRGFLRDTGNQVVLGTFIGTFVYCLLILRMVRGVEKDVFVPNLAVSGGVFLSLASVGVLIYFINHVSTSIQATHVIATVTGELNHAIDRLYPARLGEGKADMVPHGPPDSTPRFEGTAHGIAAAKSGYVQIVSEEGLLHLAQEANGILEIKARPGAFVTQGASLARLWAKTGPDAGFAKKVNRAFVVGPHRTMTQDARFGLDQLVEVAVRALSPGINDPFTAMLCLDRLGEALARMADRRMPSSCRFDANGTLRMIAVPTDFADMADTAFDPIRRAGRGSFAVLVRLLETLEMLAARVGGEDRTALRRQVALILDGREGLPEAEDRRLLASRCALTRRVLDAPPALETSPVKADRL